VSKTLLVIVVASRLDQKSRDQTHSHNSVTSYDRFPKFFHWKILFFLLFFFRTESPDSPDCLPILLSISVFTARCYASAVLAMGQCLSVCLSVSVSVSVCLSVTSRSSTKMAKRRITQTAPHDSSGTLVFCYQRSLRNSTGVTPYEGAECR